MTALTSKRGAVVAALRAAPQGLTLRQVAEAVGRSIPAARRHLADLQQEGVVTIGAIPLAARTFRLPDTTPALSPQLLPVYEAAARLPQPFTELALIGIAAGLARSRVIRAVRAMVRSGALVVATPAISGEQRVVWSLAEGVRAPPPPKNHLQPAAQRLWGAMRPLRRPFLLAELAGLACVSHRTTAAYIGALAGAGVVRCVQPALRGRPARYELARDLGMVAPSFVRDETGARVLRDNNPQLGTTAAALAAVVAAPSVRGRAA